MQSIYSGDPGIDRYTALNFHLILSYHENTHLMFSNILSTLLFPRFRGSMQLRGFLLLVIIICSHHLPKLLELNVEET